MENKATSQNQQTSDANALIFSEILKKIVADFSPRAQEIIFSRWGVFNSHPLTLEEIGKKYNITRERVRQVIREVLKKMRDKKNNAMFQEVQQSVILALEKNGGIMEEKQLLQALGKNNTSEKAAVSFFLECIDAVNPVEVKGELAFSYMLPDFDLENWRTVKNAAKAALMTSEKPLDAKELFKLVVQNIPALQISQAVFVEYLKVAEEIKQNAFGKWGMVKWKEISPKGTREKAYLVLKENGEPLHFREIAKKIDQSNLNKKKTHPQTVHNELIKDKNFVLVGRGIYALLEWGYKKGTVKDVIEEILKKSSRAMDRDEILKKVLEIRRVKKSTIVINLNNYFAKNKEGAYSLKK